MRTKAFVQLMLGVLAGDLLLAAYSFDLSSQQRQAYMTLGENRLAPLPYVEFCLRKPWRCAPSVDIRQIRLDKAHRDELEHVQREVNYAIAPLVHPLDIANLPWDDEATAGHCDDYVLAKRSRLLDRGYPSSALLLAVAIVPGGTAHLVLVVVTDRGDYVLDNLQPKMVRWDELPYQWVIRSTPANPQYWRAILPVRLLSDNERPSDKQDDGSTKSCG